MRLYQTEYRRQAAEHREAEQHNEFLRQTGHQSAEDQEEYFQQNNNTFPTQDAQSDINLDEDDEDNINTVPRIVEI